MRSSDYTSSWVLSSQWIAFTCQIRFLLWPQETVSLLAAGISGNSSSLQWGAGELEFVQVQMKPAEKWLMSLPQETCRPQVFTVLLVLKIKLLNSPSLGSVLRTAWHLGLTHCLRLSSFMGTSAKRSGVVHRRAGWCSVQGLYVHINTDSGPVLRCSAAAPQRQRFPLYLVFFFF